MRVPRLIPSASLVLLAPVRKALRSGGEYDYKILLVQRSNTGTSFLSAHVFPGGVLEGEADNAQSWQSVFQMPPEPRELFPYKIGAIRETFEECGVCLTHPKISVDEFSPFRNVVHRDAREFPKFCAMMQAKPAVDGLIHLANWITPTLYKKRFDTHFFLASWSDEDTSGSFMDSARIDEKETVNLSWWTPKEALEKYERREIILFPPQWYILQELLPLHTRDQVLSYAKGKRIEPYLPEFLHKTSNGYVMTLPGDEAHSTSKGPDVRGKQHRLHIQGDPMDNSIRQISFIEGAFRPHL